MNELILVADDEAPLLKMTVDYLGRLGFRTLSASTGAQALKVFKESHPDLVILDLMMPELDGWDTAREILKRSDTPVIFLTAREEENDRIAGLELGADDYIVKPFSPRELAARIKAVLRRVSRGQTIAGLITEGDLRIHRGERTVHQAGRIVELTSHQFDLLVVLAASPGRVFTRLQLLEATVGTAFPGYERTLDAHIKNLRRALGDDAAHPRYIETLRGAGYRFIRSGEVR